MPGRLDSPMAVSASCLTRVQRIMRIFFSSPRTAGAVTTEATDATDGEELVAPEKLGRDTGGGGGEYELSTPTGAIAAAMRATASRDRISTRSAVTRP